MPIEDALQEELDKVQEEETKTANVAKRTYDAAKRRLETSLSTQATILIAFFIISFADMGVNYLKDGNFITPEGLIFLLLGFILWIILKIVIAVYNNYNLKQQKQAIELDQEEALVRRREAETDIWQLVKQQELDQGNMKFMKEQNRLDRKQTQDLQLRVPFFETAQIELMKFFARDDIVTAIQVPATFVEAIARMDDALLKRTDIDLTVEKITEQLSQLHLLYKEMQRQLEENGKIMDQFFQRNAELVVKWQETELGVQSLRQDVRSLSACVDGVMDILRGGLPSSTTTETADSATITITTDLTSAQPSPHDDAEPSIASQVEELLEDSSSEEDSLPPPPSG